MLWMLLFQGFAPYRTFLNHSSLLYRAITFFLILIVFLTEGSFTSVVGMPENLSRPLADFVSKQNYL